MPLFVVLGAAPWTLEAFHPFFGLKFVEKLKHQVGLGDY